MDGNPSSEELSSPLVLFLFERAGSVTPAPRYLNSRLSCLYGFGSKILLGEFPSNIPLKEYFNVFCNYIFKYFSDGDFYSLFFLELETGSWF
tara:strand:- start:36 stop:311 length:276 start_codon:yes stop_codon:yes gene_type:complete